MTQQRRRRGGGEKKGKGTICTLLQGRVEGETGRFIETGDKREAGWWRRLFL